MGVAGGGSAADSGAVVPAQFSAPTQVEGLTGVVQISSTSESSHTCALVTGGVVKCWGYDSKSQLGTAPVDGGDPFSIAPLTVTF